MRIRAYGLTESDFPDARYFKEIPRGYFWDRNGQIIAGMGELAAIDTANGDAVGYELDRDKNKVYFIRLKLDHLKLPLSFGWIDEEKTLRIA